MKNLVIHLFLLVFILSCSGPEKGNEKQAVSERSDRFIPKSWVASRVEASENRLMESQGGQRILDAIKAHGGLQKWYSNGPLFLRFNYGPIGGKARDTYQVIDTWSAKAKHFLASDSSKTYGFDGSEAWFSPDSSAFVHNPRFWSLTPFYFVGIPFVFADEGIKFTILEDQMYKGRMYNLVKVTYQKGVGDAPDDFYVIYIDSETDKVGAIRYIVTYPGFYPEDGSSPEKFMNYVGAQTIEGITLPTEIDTHIWKDGEVGEKTTHTEITDVAFYPKLPEDYFEIPDDAIVQEGL